MDAKVLRAAVSAALRVTVSTTLIGCGGNVSTDPGHATSSPAIKDTPSGTAQPSTAETEQTTSPTPTSNAGGSEPGSKAPNAGMASNAGSETGGVASVAGAGGDEASAGAPADVCGAAAHACLTQLEQTPQQPPTDATKACCDVVIASLDQLRQELQPEEAECYNGVESRFMMPPVRNQCCHDPSTWVHVACTPWGPPVPPELSADALRAWSLAA